MCKIQYIQIQAKKKKKNTREAVALKYNIEIRTKVFDYSVFDRYNQIWLLYCHPHQL